MKNSWKTIWNKRKDDFRLIDMQDEKAVFLEMKRVNGFDVVGDGIPYEELVKQYSDCKEKLRLQSGEMIFEVGCGCGANLFLFHKDGIKVGGLDYSRTLVDILQKVLGAQILQECVCDEAIHIPTELKYHAVLSNSVFSYFPDYKYAKMVLNKMVDKATRSIGLIDVHDETKKEDFLQYRIMHTPNYEERYRDLPKLFYTRKFFVDFAKENNLTLEFVESQMHGYWNNDFVFDCYMYK